MNQKRLKNTTLYKRVVLLFLAIQMIGNKFLILSHFWLVTFFLNNSRILKWNTNVERKCLSNPNLDLSKMIFYFQKLNIKNQRLKTKPKVHMTICCSPFCESLFWRKLEQKKYVQVYMSSLCLILRDNFSGQFIYDQLYEIILKISTNKR